MRKMVFLMTVAGLSMTGSARADQAGWCAAYARDFADARSSEKTLWQHKYDIAQKACLDEQKAADPAPAIKKVEAPTTPAKPVVVPASKPATVTSPALAAKSVDASSSVGKTAEAKLASNSKTASGPPEPGSAAWNAYCAKKYSSFDEKTGTYKSYTGVERKCLYTG